MLLAYLGPETLLPLTSIVAGLAGACLMFGRNLVRITQHTWRVVTRRSDDTRLGTPDPCDADSPNWVRFDKGEAPPRRASERRKQARATQKHSQELAPSAKSS